MSSSRSNYEPNEVRALVENYVMLRGHSGVSPRGLWFLVRVADIQAAFSRLEPDLRHCLFDRVHGLTFREIDTVDHKRAAREYEEALARLTTCLNGGQ